MYSLEQDNQFFKASERLNKDQWQFSCRQIWYKVRLILKQVEDLTRISGS